MEGDLKVQTINGQPSYREFNQRHTDQEGGDQQKRRENRPRGVDRVEISDEGRRAFLEAQEREANSQLPSVPDHRE